MPRRIISVEVKLRLIHHAHLRNEDYVEVARTLGIARSTAYSIIHRYQQENGLVVRARGVANNVKRDEEMTNCVSEIVERHPEFTLAQINSELRTTLPNKSRICIFTLQNLPTGQLNILKKS